MQVSKVLVKKDIEHQILKILSQVVSDIRNPEEANKFLHDFFTDVEIITIAKRLAIAYYLSRGDSYETIKQNLKVSSATIASIQAKLIKNNGIKIALKKIQAEQWATKWTNIIMGIFGSEEKQSTA